MQSVLNADKASLSSNARFFACVLYSHMDADGSNCYPSITVLVRRTNTSRPRVCRSLDELACAGWIDKVERKGSRGGRYHLYLPKYPSNNVVKLHNQEISNVVTKSHERGNKTGRNLVTQCDPTKSVDQGIDQDQRNLPSRQHKVRPHSQAARVVSYVLDDD
jgi:hypothetical protein